MESEYDSNTKANYVDCGEEEKEESWYASFFNKYKRRKGTRSSTFSISIVFEIVKSCEIGVLSNNKFTFMQELPSQMHVLNYSQGTPNKDKKKD